MVLRIRSRVLGLALIVSLLLPLAGCSSWWLLGEAAAAFTAGWLANDQWAGLQDICYRNGERVDCSTLPSGLLP